MKKRKKQYSEEFKQDAVNYYYSSGKSMKDTADDLIN
ncbi:transposase [Melaminivora alkalimesophila]